MASLWPGAYDRAGPLSVLLGDSGGYKPGYRPLSIKRTRLATCDKYVQQSRCYEQVLPDKLRKQTGSILGALRGALPISYG